MMRPGVGVGVFVMKDGKFLLQKRQGSHGAGSWSLPGGHMEYGETPEQTAVRETKEEFDVSIKNPKIIGITNDFMPADSKHYITIFVEAEYDAGEPKIMDTSSAEMGWFSKDGLPSPLFIPLKNFIENKKLL